MLLKYLVSLLIILCSLLIDLFTSNCTQLCSIKSNNIMKTLNKTHHFIERSWERGYHQYDINKLIDKMENKSKKHFYLIKKNVLAKLEVKRIKANYLVIVVRDNVLITLFEVDNLYQFLKQNRNVDFSTIN